MQAAIDVITDNIAADSAEWSDKERDKMEHGASHLYGLIHARYILTTKGLQQMAEKYKNGDFGKCPRVFCNGQNLLPVGESDIPMQAAVRLYCPNCEDLYLPKSSKHGMIDGAYFGTSFPGMFFQVYPHLIPQRTTVVNSMLKRAENKELRKAQIRMVGGNNNSTGGGSDSTTTSTTTGNNNNGEYDYDEDDNEDNSKSRSVSNEDGSLSIKLNTRNVNAEVTKEKYVPSIFGFRLHEHAKLARWQLKQRMKQEKRLEEFQKYKIQQQQQQQH